MQTIALDDYAIYIGECWSQLVTFLADGKYSNLVIIVDENTKRDCLPVLLSKVDIAVFQVIEIKSGELNKNILTCQQIWQKMLAADIDRKSLVINLGGGVIGDMGGFCAATYKRGIDFIQIPTTLLSQVDSSIGGKLGIDFEQVKNSIGVFKNPKAVFIAPIFLNTLEEREIISGFAEMIKHSLIRDEAQWNILCQIKDFRLNEWTKNIIPSLHIKRAIVQEDPFEHHIRKALNFGHTVGHAVESLMLASATPLLHGEAVAVGMVCETYLSNQVIGLAPGKMKLVADYILKVFGKYELPNDRFDEMYDLMKKDKKNEGDRINFTLIDQIGSPVINQTCDRDLVAKSLEYYQSL